MEMNDSEEIIAEPHEKEKPMEERIEYEYWDKKSFWKNQREGRGIDIR